MFHRETRRTPLQSALAMAELVFHAAVRSVRKSHGNALMGLVLNIFQTVLLIVVFYLMLTLLGMRASALRGDFVLYIMSGIFVFMTHTKAMGAVSGSEGPTSPMMKHSPMNTVVAVASAALSSLYLQMLSAVVVLYVYHAAFNPITIHDPVGSVAMLLLAWASGVAIGMVVQAASPWWPAGVGMIASIYSRMNMFFSGKMILANASPALVPLFDWNPLFHIIDRARGFIFANYHPRFSSIDYPLWWTLAFLMIGLLGEFYTRKYASASWGAGK